MHSVFHQPRPTTEKFKYGIDYLIKHLSSTFREFIMIVDEEIIQFFWIISDTTGTASMLPLEKGGVVDTRLKVIR